MSMRAIASTVTAAVGLLAAVTAWAAPDGWQDLKWGMSRAQVESAYGDRLRPGRARELSKRCLDTVGVFEMDLPMPRGDATATLCFDRGKLAEVEVQMRSGESPTQELIYSDLMARYGTPVRVKRERLSDRYLWAEGDTLVEYMVIGNQMEGRNLSITLGYFWRKTQKDIEF